jgi:hypothetical protein
MTEMEIKSSYGGTNMQFSELEGETFRATISSRDYTGTVKVSSYPDNQGLAKLFVSMAKEWRGWHDEKSWSSLEGEFAISCTHDRLGHITLNVTIDQEFGLTETWRLRASIAIDAGQLESISKDAARFFKT